MGLKIYRILLTLIFLWAEPAFCAATHSTDSTPIRFGYEMLIKSATFEASGQITERENLWREIVINSKGELEDFLDSLEIDSQIRLKHEQSVPTRNRKQLISELNPIQTNSQQYIGSAAHPYYSAPSETANTAAVSQQLKDRLEKEKALHNLILNEDNQYRMLIALFFRTREGSPANISLIKSIRLNFTASAELMDKLRQLSARLIE